jgi:hypothetical protein
MRMKGALVYDTEFRGRAGLAHQFGAPGNGCYTDTCCLCRVADLKLGHNRSKSSTLECPRGQIAQW